VNRTCVGCFRARVCHGIGGAGRPRPCRSGCGLPHGGTGAVTAGPRVQAEADDGAPGRARDRGMGRYPVGRPWVTWRYAPAAP
jgi:hypothetical protein